MNGRERGTRLESSSLRTLLHILVCHALLSASASLAQGVSALLLEVTDSHLPTASLRGFSMDAHSADLDGDGDLDIVIASEFRANLLLLNDGSGHFTDAGSRLPRSRRDSEDVAIADFDRDGDPDIVIVSEDDQVNELYLNDGRGRFLEASERLPVTGVSNAVLAADLDGDGAPDILIGNNGQNAVLINDGRGFFLDESAERLPARRDVTQDIELGDIDLDGDLDLLVANEDANRLYLNDGHGVFREPADALFPLRAAPEESREGDFGDVDGDGDLDIFFANVQLFVADALRQNRLLINDGGGLFSDETALRLPPDLDQTMDGDLVDIDHDGDLDLLTANFDDLSGQRASAPYRVYLNDGYGVFEEATAPVFPRGVIGNGFDIEAADFNGDGLVDVYLASRGGTDRLLLAVEAK